VANTFERSWDVVALLRVYLALELELWLAAVPRVLRKLLFFKALTHS